MLRKWLCQAEIKIIIEPVDPVLIKSGYATIDGTDMVPVSTFKDDNSVYYFPGTSLKGILRSHLERVARTLHPGSVCIPYYDPKKKIPIPVAAEKDSHGCGYRTSGNTSTQAYADSCAMCRLFGSLKFGGRCSISDAYPLPDHQPSLELRNGVGIDRFTGGTVSGVLFDLQVLVGGKFETNLRLINFELWQLAALNILLLDMKDEMIAIGSGRSRGLGRVRITVPSYCLSYVQNVSYLKGLYELVTTEEQAAYCFHDWVPQNTINLPTSQPRGLRHRYDLSTNWDETLEPLFPAFEQFLKWHGGPRGQASNDEAAAEQEVGV